TVLRAVLYALMEVQQDVEIDLVVQRLTHNITDYYANRTRREQVIAIARFLAERLARLRPAEASAARVLAEAVRNQRIG
ncbi:MAG: hypothetical protein N2385_14730, partial [Chloroflexus sp.]|nr:hypothetical protein [Chloroflexus sp.]